MKAIALLLVLCFSLPSFASRDALNDLINEQNFYLTVTWDQQDQVALANRTEFFKQQLRQSFLNGEITQEDIDSYLVKKLSPETLYVLKNARPDDYELIQTIARDSRVKGANWNGSTLVSVSASVFVIAGVVGAFVLMGKNCGNCNR